MMLLAAAIDQFLMRLGYTADTNLDEVADEVERLRRLETHCADRISVYRCPVHGLIESPRFYGPPYTTSPDEECMTCPINLSTNEGGITDDVCDQTCEGPFTVEVVA
jgi:hypothetical protein